MRANAGLIDPEKFVSVNEVICLLAGIEVSGEEMRRALAMLERSVRTDAVLRNSRRVSFIIAKPQL
jgi:hypothetical protein